MLILLPIIKSGNGTALNQKWKWVVLSIPTVSIMLQRNFSRKYWVEKCHLILIPHKHISREETRILIPLLNEAFLSEKHFLDLVKKKKKRLSTSVDQDQNASALLNLAFSVSGTELIDFEFTTKVTKQINRCYIILKKKKRLVSKKIIFKMYLYDKLSKLCRKKN